MRGINAETFTREYFRCPHCHKGQFSAEHIKEGGKFGPWYCDDCGGSFVGGRLGDGQITLGLRDERKILTSNVLVLPPQTEPVFFIVPGMRFEPEHGGGDSDPQESARYHYEEHSCPTNWFEPEMVYHDGDADPHGLLKFVRSVDSDTLPPDQDHGPNDRDFALVKLIEEAKALAARG